MSDDTLDVDELEETGKEEPAEPRAPEKPPKKPGLLARIGQRLAGLVPRRLGDDLLSYRNLAIGVIALLVIWLLAANGSPVRIVLWFWTVDVPKWIAFLVDVALGALLMWLWLRWRERGKAAAGGEGGQ